MVKIYWSKYFKVACTIARSQVRNHNNKHDLIDAIKTEWQKIPMETKDSLIDYMSRRCKTVLKNKGYPTKYKIGKMALI